MHHGMVSNEEHDRTRNILRSLRKSRSVGRYPMGSAGGESRSVISTKPIFVTDGNPVARVNAGRSIWARGAECEVATALWTSQHLSTVSNSDLQPIGRVAGIEVVPVDAGHSPIVAGDNLAEKGATSMIQEFAQIPRPKWRALVSMALGLAALIVVLATFIIMQDNQDIRVVSIVSYCAFAAAGFASPRGTQTFNWTGALAVSLGGILPELALRMSSSAFTDNFYAALIATVAVVAALIGVTTRALVSRRRALLAGAVSGFAFAGAVLGALSGVPRLLDERAFVTVDRTVAPFSVRTLDGGRISSGIWRGRFVVLSYWATWCPPCLAEIPVLSALQRKYKGDPRVAIVALNAGYGGDTALKAREFLDHRHFDIASEIDDIKLDGQKQGEAALSLGLKAVPTLFILSPEQRLIAVHVGFDSSEHLVATLSKRIDSLVSRSP